MYQSLCLYVHKQGISKMEYLWNAINFSLRVLWGCFHDGGLWVCKSIFNHGMSMNILLSFPQISIIFSTGECCAIIVTMLL